MHILLVRFSSMGDVIIQTAFLNWIKHNYPHAKISFLTAKEFSPLLKQHQEIEQIWELSRNKGWKDIVSLRSMAKKLKHIDVVFDLHNNLRSRLLGFFLNKPLVRVNKRSFKRRFMVATKINLLKKEPSQHKRVMEDFGFLFKQKLDWGELDVAEGNKPLTSLGLNPIKAQKKYLVISPVASFEAKRWPMEYYSQLIEKIVNDSDLREYEIKLVAGPADTYLEGLKFAEDRVTNLQGKTNLQESSEVIAGSELCITNDTGALHIAEASGVPTLAIFGATSPYFGFRPHLKQSHYFYAGVKCSPCSTTGSKPCKKPRHFCMLDIHPDSVYSKVKEILVK